MSLHVATRRALLIPKATDDGPHHLEATCAGDTTFDPSITAGSTGHWVMGDGSADRDSNAFSHVYTGGPYDLYAYWTNATDVTTINLFGDELTALDVTALTSLADFQCHSNSISTLDVSALTSLTKLRCNSNSISVLDVTLLTSLTTLTCYTNSISTLDVSALTSLTSIACYANSISTLDVSSLTSLTSVICYNNSISTLDVPLLTSLTTLRCGDNNMVEAEVDNILADLVTAGASDGTCEVHGTNAVPSAAGLASKATLETAGWTVTCST